MQRGIPSANQSCDTLRGEYLDTLQTYDENNDGKIDINELGDAGADFAQDKLTEEKLKAVGDAFQNDCTFPTGDPIAGISDERIAQVAMTGVGLISLTVVSL